MSYVIDKEMIHRCNADRMPTYCIVATATNSGATQTIKSEVLMGVKTQIEARADCITALAGKDAGIA